MKLEAQVNGESRNPDEAAAADAVEIRPDVYSVLINGRSFDVQLEPLGEGEYEAFVDGRRHEIELRDPRRYRPNQSFGRSDGPQTLTAPMPGKVVSVSVQTGDAVETEQGLLVVEAMKMQNEIRSPKAGVAVDVRVAPGDSVAPGQALVVVE